MMVSNEQSKTPSPPISKFSRLAAVMAGIAILGFADATYLTAEHFLNRVPPCSIIKGCATVTTSQYSLLFGIPVALLGALYYLAVILGVVYYFQSKKRPALKAVALFTSAGFVFSLWFVYLQLFVIHAICAWCMFSACTSTALFIIGMWVIKSLRAYGNDTPRSTAE